jgi:hypothetical protein
VQNAHETGCGQEPRQAIIRNMMKALLPLPDVTELQEVPAELADAIQLLEVPAAQPPSAIAKDARAKGKAVDVVHVDDPRASIFALFD